MQGAGCRGARVQRGRGGEVQGAEVEFLCLEVQRWRGLEVLSAEIQRCIDEEMPRCRGV